MHRSRQSELEVRAPLRRGHRVPNAECDTLAAELGPVRLSSVIVTNGTEDKDHPIRDGRDV